jgi:thiol-disulfide isomerase/thioredoxin
VSSRSRTPLVIAAAVAVVVVAAVVAFVVSGGGDDATSSTAPPAAGTTGGSSGGAVEAYGVVTVDGDALPSGEGADDPAIGTPAPALHGTDYAGTPTSVVPGEDGPLMVVFLAHWCPHCNREVPVLNDWKASGDVPDGLSVVGVSTAVTDQRPNFPPGEWLQSKGWTWPVIADDEAQTAAAAYGVTGYPYMVFLDASGDVVGRVSGEQSIETIQALADAAVGTT